MNGLLTDGAGIYTSVRDYASRKADEVGKRWRPTVRAIMALPLGIARPFITTHYEEEGRQKLRAVTDEDINRRFSADSSSPDLTDHLLDELLLPDQKPKK